MTEEQINISVRLSIQRALLGVITPSIRMITVGWDELKMLKIRAYFDCIPDAGQIEDIDAACAEVVSDIEFERDNVECIFSASALKDLEILKFVAYSRKER